MNDIRAIRENHAAFDAALARRGKAPVSSQILALDSERRACIQEAEAAQAEINSASKEVGAAKAKGDEAEFERLRGLVSEKKAQVANLTEQAKVKDEALTDMLMGIDNLPYDDTPDGADEADNVEIRHWGTPATFDFAPKEHFELLATQAGLDF